MVIGYGPHQGRLPHLPESMEQVPLLSPPLVHEILHDSDYSFINNQYQPVTAIHIAFFDQ